MSATSPEPFNPEDPFDAMAETIRRGITQVALDAFSTALYRELDSTRQLECFVAGALSGGRLLDGAEHNGMPDR